MVNINVEIPQEVHKKLKVESVLVGTTLKEEIIEILEHSVSKK